MNRSKKIVVTCHCILNANAKVTPLATVGALYFVMIYGVSLASKRIERQFKIAGRYGR